LLALYAGQGNDDEEASERLPLMLLQIGDWFTEEFGNKYGGTLCHDIAGDEVGTPEVRARCGGIILETYIKGMEILKANGFDPSGG